MPPCGEHRVALLGQKDALTRALYELAHRRRLHPMKVLVAIPKARGAQAPNQKPSAADGLAGDIPGLCAAFGFRCFVGSSNALVLEELQAFGPTLIVSILWPKRIQDSVLALCRDCINFHPSLLPRHRGSITQFWAIFEGDTEAGVTCHRMVHEFDAGRILRQTKVPVRPGETAVSLNRQIAGAVETCFSEVMSEFFTSGLREGRAWNAGDHKYNYNKFPNDGAIDPSWPIDKIDRFIRAMFYPPFTPAVYVDGTGERHAIETLEQFEAASGSAESVVGGSSAATRLPWSHWLLGAPVLLAALIGACMSHAWTSKTLTGGVNVAERFTLSGHSRARCLDGSAPSFYVAPSSSSSGQSKWLLYLQGGGWCSEDVNHVAAPGYSHEKGVAHPSLCSERSTTYLGSSKYDYPRRNLSERSFLSGDPSVNPMMYHWNRVILRNCDGTAYLSSLDAPLSAGGHTLYFRGRDNVIATLDALLAGHGMSDATDIVIAGCSAGGIAAVLLADWLRQKLEASLRHRAFVTVLSDSGVFPEWHGGANPRGVLDFPQFQWLYEHTNVSAGVPPRCMESGLGPSCLRVGRALPFVHTPTFVLQSAVDTWQLADIADGPHLEQLARSIQEQVRSGLRYPHAGAVDGCLHHCGEWGLISWGGRSNAQLFQDWYDDRRRSWLQNATFSCAGCGKSVASEGWPLLHVAGQVMDGCSPNQAEHRRWHQTVRRV